MRGSAQECRLNPKENEGYCTCCRTRTVFEAQGEWLRDQYLCKNCGSIPRQRHINLILDQQFGDWSTLSIHESSPTNDFIARWNNKYSCSHYFEGAVEGCYVNGTRCENLEKLTFSDNSFDLVITQDVFEHVFQPDRAALEIMRVLKPAGAHVFTTPKYPGLRNSRRRAKIDTTGKIKHLIEPVYHGNPIGDGRSLVTWDYGDDFDLLMWAWSGCPTATYVTRDRNLGIDGEFLEVFVTRKWARRATLVDSIKGFWTRQ